MPLTELKEILQRSIEKPNPTARDKKIGARLQELFLDPIASRVQSVGLEVVEMGGHSSTKPQHIVQIKLAVPTRDDLLPQLRIALTEVKKGEEKPYDCYLGATICQLSKSKGGPYPPHVRWGLWADSVKVKDRVPGPFRLIAGKMGWKHEDHIVSRPLNNTARGWLSMLGKMPTLDEIDQFSNMDDLADRIAQDLVGLNNVIRK